MKQLTLEALLTAGAERNLRDANPWWKGERQYDVAMIRRWAYAPVLKGLLKGLAPVTVLRGPRQVGKTTLLNQVIDELLNQGVDPQRIFRVQFDDIPDLRKLGTPILDLSAWYADNVVGQSFHAFAREQHGPCICFSMRCKTFLIGPLSSSIWLTCNRFVQSSREVLHFELKRAETALLAESRQSRLARCYCVRFLKCVVLLPLPRSWHTTG